MRSYFMLFQSYYTAPPQLYLCACLHAYKPNTSITISPTELGFIGYGLDTMSVELLLANQYFLNNNNVTKHFSSHHTQFHMPRAPCFQSPVIYNYLKWGCNV